MDIQDPGEWLSHEEQIAPVGQKAPHYFGRRARDDDRLPWIPVWSAEYIALLISFEMHCLSCRGK